jgi:tetratricopeptide (TPR) repeat protein
LRSLPSVEVCFRLGDELLRIGRSEEAKRYFARGAKIAPQSPLPSEGLGLLAADKGASHEAIRLLGEALQRGSTSFLAHYEYAAQQLRVASGSGENSGAINEETADKIKSELEKSLSLMPNFGRAQHMLGLFELIQGQDAAIAEKHLQKAVQLEPENLTYLLSLAQSQLLKNDFVSARKTLDLLRRPYVSENLRARAAQLTKEIEGHTQNQRKQP